MTATLELCEITIDRCRCGARFPVLPELGVPDRCRSCQRHDVRSTNRIDESSPSYRLAADVSTYLAALRLVCMIGERAVVDETGTRRELVLAVQEMVEAADTAVMGVLHRDRPISADEPERRIPSPRTAPDDAAVPTSHRSPS